MRLDREITRARRWRRDGVIPAVTDLRRGKKRMAILFRENDPEPAPAPATLEEMIEQMDAPIPQSQEAICRATRGEALAILLLLRERGFVGRCLVPLGLSRVDMPGADCHILWIDIEDGRIWKRGGSETLAHHLYHRRFANGN